MQKNTLLKEIDIYKNQIDILKNRKDELLNELKKANIEYEKMKYLQAEEIKKIVKKERLKESQEIDEIAIILNSYNK